MKNFYEKQLVSRFEKQKTFSRQELYDFYLNYKPEMSEGTFGWRIYELKKRNLIKNVGKGIYSLSQKPEYLPTLDDSSKKIARLLIKIFRDLKYCVWETSWLNEFSNHQIGTHFIILEIEKDLINSAFFALKDNNVKDLFLQPGEREMEIYILEKENPVILKCLISRSPIQKIRDKYLKINIPTLEKILTDLYCDRDIFYFFSGKELENIFENALNRYTINFSRLFSYANRRGKEIEIKDFIKRKLNYLLDDIVK